MGYKPRTLSSSGPVKPIGWQEEHIWPVRVLFKIMGLSHCGKKGWRL